MSVVYLHILPQSVSFNTICYAIALSSLLPSCSSCLRGSLKKDVGELKGCDRCLGSGGEAIAFGGVRECDRFLGG